jgi:hypothetical protein
MKNSKGLFIKREYGRVPRKLKKQIPKNTHYCYTPTSGFKYFEDGSYGFETKVCPFSTWIKFKDMNPKPEWCDEKDLIEYADENINWCKLVKTEIEDQCKSCGLRYGRN